MFEQFVEELHESYSNETDSRTYKIFRFKYSNIFDSLEFDKKINNVSDIVNSSVYMKINFKLNYYDKNIYSNIVKFCKANNLSCNLDSSYRIYENGTYTEYYYISIQSENIANDDLESIIYELLDEYLLI